MRTPPERQGDDALRYRTCEVCGQRYDTTDLDQVFHHDGEPHEPLGSRKT
jgi:hypothetical protein